MIVTLYRHGYSQSNAGEATESPAGSKLVPKGVEQARLLARRFKQPPTLIVTSPFIRTGQTAAPTRERFPEVPHVERSIQEYTYLEPSGLVGTNHRERVAHSTPYWERADPYYRDGPGAESFFDLLVRVEVMLKLLAEQGGDVAVFTHGNFMRAVFWLFMRGSQESALKDMAGYRQLQNAVPIPNTACLPMVRHEGRWHLGQLKTDHIPPELVTH